MWWSAHECPCPPEVPFSVCTGRCKRCKKIENTYVKCRDGISELVRVLTERRYIRRALNGKLERLGFPTFATSKGTGKERVLFPDYVETGV